MIKNIAAYLLKYIDPHKPLGTLLFNAIAKVTVSVAFEAVAIRKNPETGKSEVYMVRRPDDDAAYPGQWHVPGSVLRPHEKDNHVFSRLSKREFGTRILRSKFIAMVSHPREARGHFISLVYRVQVEGEPQGGKWFPLDGLPTTTVGFHKKYIIPIAAGDKRFEDIAHFQIKLLDI